MKNQQQRNIMKSLTMLSLLLLISCGKKTETIIGESGKSCTVEQKAESAVITCDDGSSAEVFNGKDGKSAYEIAQDSGFTGTLSQWIASLSGQDGSDGQDGTNGTNGKSAYEVAVSNGFVGTKTQWLESLVGLQGEAGLSAYEVAVENNFVGTEVDFLSSLIGEDGANGINGQNGQNGQNGTNGDDGLNAYELAVLNGYSGTTTQWLESLVGADGLNGQNGNDGASAYELAVLAGYNGTITQWLASLNGTDGQDGADGQDGTTPAINGLFIEEVVSFCSATDEIGIRLSDGTLIAYFQTITMSGNNGNGTVKKVDGRLKVLSAGTYMTTDGGDCRFRVNQDGSVDEL